MSSSEPVAPPEEVPHTNGTSPPKPTILLIHGLWMTGLCWEHWITFFATHGYTAIAPSWPGFGDRTPAEIRADPKALEGLTIHAVVNHYVKIIETLPSPPIIMGHSFGGLFVQILLSHERVALGPRDLVAILRDELLATIARHIEFDPEKLSVKMDRAGAFSTLEIDVELPTEKIAASSPRSETTQATAA